MIDEAKAGEQLSDELSQLRRRVAELEATVAQRDEVERSLRDRLERYRIVVDNIQDGLTVVEQRAGGVPWQIIYANERALDIHGYPRDEYMKLTLLDLAAPQERDRLRQIMGQIAAAGVGRGEIECWIARKDGTQRRTKNSYVLSRSSEGLLTLLNVATDITDQYRVEEALRESEERYHSLFEGSRDAIYITTREGKFVDVNQATAVLFGYTRQELLSLNIQQLYADPTDRPRFQFEIEQRGYVRDYEIQFRRKDGALIDCLLNSTVRRDTAGRTIGYQGVMTDVTERKQSEDAIRRLAYYDVLTGLPNRVLFNNRLALELARAGRAGQRVAVMLLDLDHFKDVNDTLGHTAGDRLLKEIGQRLAGALRKSDTVARMGGDEFLILLPELTRDEAAAVVADKVLEAIRQPVVVDGHVLHITSSIGIAIYPDDGRDAESLIKNADVAMYNAKGSGRNRYRRYVPTETSAAN